MHLGVDYYPEQWVFPYGGTAENPEAAWEHDADLMVKAGFNIVRIGAYAWGLCEREEGKYDFSWLQRVMDLMAKREIKVVLGTPTAAPPAWLTQKYPNTLARDEHGHRLLHGTRCHYCVNSPEYHARTVSIVTQMAQRFGKNPHVIGWQFDNEFNTICYCDTLQS